MWPCSGRLEHDFYLSLCHFFLIFHPTDRTGDQ